MRLTCLLFITLLFFRCDVQEVDLNGIWVLESREFEKENDGIFSMDFSFWIKFLDNKVVISDTNKELPVWKYREGSWFQNGDTITIDISTNTGMILPNSLNFLGKKIEENVCFRFIIQSANEDRMELLGINNWVLYESISGKIGGGIQVNEIGISKGERFTIKRTNEKFYWSDKL
ncbi:MAG: hypothetical protein ACI9XO_000853 [Paraglaciecola sp.]|jgi:hypothetical protein